MKIVDNFLFGMKPERQKPYSTKSFRKTMSTGRTKANDNFVKKDFVEIRVRRGLSNKASDFGDRFSFSIQFQVLQNMSLAGLEYRYILKRKGL